MLSSFRYPSEVMKSYCWTLNSKECQFYLWGGRYGGSPVTLNQILIKYPTYKLIEFAINLCTLSFYFVKCAFDLCKVMTLGFFKLISTFLIALVLMLCFNVVWFPSGSNDLNCLRLFLLLRAVLWVALLDSIPYAIFLSASFLVLKNSLYLIFK